MRDFVYIRYASTKAADGTLAKEPLKLTAIIYAEGYSDILASSSSVQSFKQK